MNYIVVDKKIFAFTITELMVAITISVLLLGGIFYFMSDTILGISRSSAQTEFLKDFYSFTTILESGRLEILHDYSGGGFDVAMLTTVDNSRGVLIGVVDMDTRKLSPASQGNIYHNSILAYRSLSSQEFSDIQADSDVVYNYEFFPDKMFSRFNLRDFQLTSFESGDIVEMRMDISPNFNPSYVGKQWNTLPQDEIFSYGLTF